VYFSDAVKVLLRRWRIVLVGALLMASAAVVAIKVVPTNHQATGQVLLLPPSQPAPTGSRINPYLNLPSGLTFTASLIAGAVTTLDVQRDMDAAGFSSPYSVSVVPGSGPLLVISVEDTDPSAAIATRNELIDRINAELLRIQQKEDVPETQIIIAREFGVSQQAEVLAGAKLRALAVIVALGAILTAIVVFSVERAASRRLNAERSPDGPALAGSNANGVASAKASSELNDVTSEPEVRAGKRSSPVETASAERAGRP